MNKTLKVMTSAALLAGVVAPAVASADTDARVSGIVTIADDATNQDIATLTLKEFDDYQGDLTTAGSFTLTFPEGVEVTTATNLVKLEANGGAGVDINGLNGGSVTIIGKRTVNVKLPTTGFDTTSRDAIVIKPNVTLKSEFTGSTIDVKVEDFGAGVKAGTYTLANVAGGDTTSVALNSETVGEAGGQLGAIRITENSVGTLTSGDEITLKLPKGMTFTAVPVIGLGGLNNVNVVAGTLNQNKYTFKINSNPAGGVKSVLQITPSIAIDGTDADFGDIVVNISGDDVTEADVTIGKYADYNIEVKADGDAKELIAGRYDNSDKSAQKLQKLVIKEKINGSFVNRKAKIEFPEGVKVVGVKVDGDANLGWAEKGNSYFYNVSGDTITTVGGAALNTNGSGLTIDENEVEFVQPQYNGVTELKFEFYVSVAANFTGDIEAKVSGSGVEGTALLGKVVAPLTATTTPKDVQIGIRGQEVGTLVLTESKAEALKDNKKVEVRLTDAQWSKKPTIKVVEGDLEIDEDTIKINSSDKSILEFVVDSASTKASKIEISGGQVDLDRAVPEGDLTVKVGGDFIENDESNNTAVNTSGVNQYEKQIEFKQNNIGEYTIAKVVTPAPGKVTVEEVKFTIGATSYTVGGVEKAMDVAPFVEAGRTYMPIRYVGETLGADIYWDQATQTATLMKGDRVVQLTAGSKSLKINGASITMDAAAKVKDGRTVLPVRFVGQALGATVDYNEADKTVTVK